MKPIRNAALFIFLLAVLSLVAGSVSVLWLAFGIILFWVSVVLYFIHRVTLGALARQESVRAQLRAQLR